MQQKGERLRGSSYDKVFLSWSLELEDLAQEIYVQAIEAKYIATQYDRIFADSDGSEEAVYEKIYFYCMIELLCKSLWNINQLWGDDSFYGEMPDFKMDELPELCDDYCMILDEIEAYAFKVMDCLELRIVDAEDRTQASVLEDAMGHMPNLYRALRAMNKETCVSKEEL